MLCIGIEFLTGYYVATHPSARKAPEWPPHPARVFMAMAAAYFETGENSAEAQALEFVEAIESLPSIFASPAQPRTPVTHFVPVNDNLDPNGAQFPLLRSPQPREFPRVRPDDPVVYYRWSDAAAGPEITSALRSLCSKVTRIGHSSSLVRVWLAGEIPDAAARSHWAPDETRAEERLRTATPGSLAELRRLFRAEDREEFGRLKKAIAVAKGMEKKAAKEAIGLRFGNGEPHPVRPEFQATAGYRIVNSGTTEPARGVWSDNLIAFGLRPLESAHRKLDILDAPALVNSLRRAMLKAAERFGPIPEYISGHKPDAVNSPSEQPHCVIMPVPFVGREHADGHILGVAVAMPRNATAADRRLVVRTLEVISKAGLNLGRLGKWQLMPEVEGPSLHNLRPSVWTGGSHGALVWCSVTPISFDKHPKCREADGYLYEVREMLANACLRVGLPMPQRIDISHVSFVKHGVPTAREFARLTRKDGAPRSQVHVRILFPRPVAGPVVLGAGRYRGYGLLRPLPVGENNG
jgi:CRISPR-associated protein Csb2